MRFLGAALLSGAAAGCASYRPLPLEGTQPLPASVPRITIYPRDLPLPELRQHVFDASNGLDAEEVAMLAVVNNPDLKLAREDARIKRAQAFASRLLPDPQLAATADRPTSSDPSLVTAYSLGLSEDITALLTYSARRSVAGAEVKGVDLGLLWQEWQVVTKARLLYVRLTQSQKQLAVLEENRRLFADRYARTKKALDEGLVTLDAVTPNLTALQDMTRQIHDVERTRNGLAHDLNSLLGLAPEAGVPLEETVDLPPLDEQAIVARLPELPNRRPDLVALRYAYQAQDERYRAVILGQFPTFTLGFTRARDTSNIATVGLGITLSLPFFDGNRGKIRVEQATRARLHDEYAIRSQQADAEIRRLLDEQRINLRQLDEVDRGLAELAEASRKAKTAFAARAIDALAFTGLQSSYLAKRIEKISLEQSILEQRVALENLIGRPLP